MTTPGYPVPSRVDGGPAFPHIRTTTHGDVARHEGPGGMSIRQWYSGQALLVAGLLIDKPPGEVTPEEIAEAAHRIADAMLAEDAKAVGPP